MAHLEEENLQLTMNNEQLRLENNQVKRNIEISTLKKESLVLKKLKIQAYFPYFTEAMFLEAIF